MQTILLLDQPVNNRGDEAAHKSLLRKLIQEYPEYKIICLLRNVNIDTINQMRVNAPQIEYVNLPNAKGYRKIREYLIRYNLKILNRVFFFNRILDRYINNSDLIVVSPGGMNLGGFKTWNHLYIMLRCKAQKKQVIYYSRSVGPFYYDDPKDRLFSKLSIGFLKSVSFLSIRDTKSGAIALNNGIKYMESIDTAFLDVPNINISSNLSEKLIKEYVVFVPNELKWHPAFKHLDPELLSGIYHNIINYVCENSSYNIVMLPQLYNVLNRDFLYFGSLKDKNKYNHRIIVVEDKYSSDEQQMIISKSKMVIGARYHSIVFAVNNLRPFISLSYEHKMFGLLEKLKMSARSIPFANINDIANFDINIFAKLFNERDTKAVEIAQKYAFEIADDTFRKAFKS